MEQRNSPSLLTRTGDRQNGNPADGAILGQMCPNGVKTTGGQPTGGQTNGIVGKRINSTRALSYWLLEIGTGNSVYLDYSISGGTERYLASNSRQ